MSKHKNVFDSDSGDEVADFNINENYAQRYDKWRSKEEYEKLKAREDILQSSDESSDEEGDNKTYGKPINPEFDREFLMSIGTIYKHKTGSVDVKDVQFFDGDYRVEKDKKEKPMTVKDFERHVILHKEGKFEDVDLRKMKGMNIPKGPSIIKFDDGLDDTDDDGDGDGLLTSGLFKPKEDTIDDMEEVPQNEAVEFVKGTKVALADEKQQDVLGTVKTAWTSEKLSKKDKWLVDFFLNERYLGNGDDKQYGDSAIFSEEEMTDEDTGKSINPLASQYKFRHQEPGDLIKHHPRNVPDSVRHKDEKRSKKREAAKQRQVEKKEEKRKEIELLKAMKYKEIQEKIERIKAASGNDDIDLGNVNFDEDFDPDAHDAYMEKMLGNDYYNDCNVEQELPEFQEEMDETDYYDNWTQSGTAADASYQEGVENEDIEDEAYEYYNDGELIMDADYDPARAEEAKKVKKSVTRRKVRHRSKFSKAVEKKKPLFDPNEKDFASYFEDYYKLDYEDIVGGIPCRFKYRKVIPNNFGLTTGEILAAQNCDLNKWVGIKTITQYDRGSQLEEKDRVRYHERAKHDHVLHKFLPSLFDENPEVTAEREREKRRLKNLKKKQKKWMLREGIVEKNTPEDEKIKGTSGIEDKGSSEVPVISEVKEEISSHDEILTLGSPKKKNKKRNNDENEHKILEKVVLEESQAPVTSLVKEEILGQDEMSTSESPKKKKKKILKNCVLMESEAPVTCKVKEENSSQDEMLPLENPKKKKKRRNNNENEHKILEKVVLEESEAPVTSLVKEEILGQDEISTSESPKKKKKKRYREDEHEIHGNDVMDENEAIVKEESTDGEGISNLTVYPPNGDLQKPSIPNPKKKKQKKNKVEESNITKNNDTWDGNYPQQKPATDQNIYKNFKKPRNPSKGHTEKYKNHKVWMKENPFTKNSKKSRNLDRRMKKYKGVPYFKGISDARLEAYGQKPKDVKKRVLYGEDF